MKILLKALKIATDAHANQTRKGSDAPYIIHPISVAQTLTDHGFSDESLLAAAVLHDVVEDTRVTAEDLHREFGSRIAEIVDELTDDRTLPKHERKLEVVRHIGSRSREARLIKIADLVSNVSSLPDQWPRFRKDGYIRWAENVMQQMPPTHDDLEKLLADTIVSARARLRKRGPARRG